MHINITHRQAGLGVLGIAVSGAWLATIISVLKGDAMQEVLPSIVAGVIFSALLVVYLRAEQYAPIVLPVVVVAYTALIMVGIQEPYVSQQLSLAVITPSLLAAVLLDLPWIIGCGLATLIAFVVRSGGRGPLAEPFNLLVFIACIGMIGVIQLVAATARRRAEQNADHAEQARTVAEAQAATIQTTNNELSAYAEQQRQLVELISVLETPVVQLADTIFFAPIVGYVDTRRADALQERLLRVAFARRATLMILDLSSIADTDTAVAGVIAKTAQALRLLGTEVILCGISATLAMTFGEMQIVLEGIRTVITPQEVLEQHYRPVARIKADLLDRRSN